MRRRVVVLVFAASAVVVLAAVGAVSAFAGSPIQRATAGAADPVVRGRQLFLVSCSSCHGAAGEGTGQGPSLIGVGAAAADFQLSTGRMPLADPNAQAVRKPPAFNRVDIDALVAYVASFGPGPAIPRIDPAAGNLSTGGTLFLQNCAACHSATGVGGALSYGHDAPSLSAATATQIAEAVRTGPGQMPVFGPDTLSHRQLTSIVRYVRYLRDPADPGGFSLGRVGPITEGMVALLLGLPVLLFVTRRIEEAHERTR